MTSITSGYPLAPGRGSHYATRNASSQPLDSMAVGPFTALQRALEARESQEEKVERASATAPMTQSLQATSAFHAQQLSQDDGRAASQKGGADDGESAAGPAFHRFMVESTAGHQFEPVLGPRGGSKGTFEW